MKWRLSVTILGCAAMACNLAAPRATPPTSPTASRGWTPTPSPTLTPNPTDSPAPAVNRTVTGIVSRDEIWRGELLITGDVVVDSSSTLTIEPGTIVRFTAQQDDAHGGPNEDLAVPERQYFPNDPPAIPATMISIQVNPGGRLVAQGTDAKPIVFTSDSATPRVNDWQGFDLWGDGDLVLEHTRVEYAYWAVQLDSDSGLKIGQTTFEHIATCAICPGLNRAHAGELVVSGNTFIDCGHEGVYSHGGQNLVVKGNRFIDNVVGVIANDGSTIRIEGNFFEGNRTAISINNRGNPTIVGNEIMGSTMFGIWLWEDSRASVTGNNIYGNATNLGLGRSPGNTTAENNWWGSADAGAIAYSIHDGNDENGLGMVDFNPFSSSQLPLEVPR